MSRVVEQRSLTIRYANLSALLFGAAQQHQVAVRQPVSHIETKKEKELMMSFDMNGGYSGRSMKML